MPDRFEMDGFVIERCEDNDEQELYNLTSPTPIAALAIDHSFLLARMAGRRRCGTHGSSALRQQLFLFLTVNGPISCYFCQQNAIGLHRYFVPYCDDHTDAPLMCGDCGSWTMPDDFDSDHDLCQNCMDSRTIECENCGTETTEYENIGGESFCSECVENMTRCQNCGRRVGDGQDYCAHCRREVIPVHEAHARVVDVLHSQRYGEEAKDKIYFGIELELEVSGCDGGDGDFSESCGEILNAMGRDFIILKYDGSLGPGGVEINTLPCTLKVQKEKWEDFFKNKPSGLTSWKNNRCGIHIHVTRQPLGMLTIGKMTVFLNDPKNKEFIKQIAGRYDNGYCKVKEKKITDTNGEDRYEMLNLTSSRTVEMRIFKGTLNRVHFLADVEFAHALVHFCRTTSIRNLDTAKFIQYIRQNRKDYPNLYTFSCKEEKGEDV